MTSCQVCYADYASDDENLIPRRLNCDHILCTGCIKNDFSDDMFYCPECYAEHTGSTLDGFSSAISIDEAESKSEVELESVLQPDSTQISEVKVYTRSQCKEPNCPNKAVANDFCLAHSKHRNQSIEDADRLAKRMSQGHLNVSFSGKELKEVEMAGKTSPEDLMQKFKDQGRLQLGDAIELIDRAKAVMRKEPNILRLDAPIITVGDIHGQYYDLVNLLKEGGDPGTKESYLFLGDYVDRGSFSCEVMFLLLSLKVAYPEKIWLLRGNHESASVSGHFGFKQECSMKYGINVYYSFSIMFQTMPLAAVISTAYGDIFACHGGLSPSLKTLDDIDKIDRFVEPESNAGLLDILWSDPVSEDNTDTMTNEEYKDFMEIEWRQNPTRGCSYCFGYKALKSFLHENNLVCVVRAHEVQEEGFKKHFDPAEVEQRYKEILGSGSESKTAGDSEFPPLITIFSAPNYCDRYENRAAILRIPMALNDFKVIQYECVEHPVPEIQESQTDNYVLAIVATCPYMPTSFSKMVRLAVELGHEDESALLGPQDYASDSGMSDNTADATTGSKTPASPGQQDAAADSGVAPQDNSSAKTTVDEAAATTSAGDTAVGADKPLTPSSTPSSTPLVVDSSRPKTCDDEISEEEVERALAAAGLVERLGPGILSSEEKEEEAAVPSQTADNRESQTADNREINNTPVGSNAASRVQQPVLTADFHALLAGGGGGRTSMVISRGSITGSSLGEITEDELRRVQSAPVGTAGRRKSLVWSEQNGGGGGGGSRKSLGGRKRRESVSISLVRSSVDLGAVASGPVDEREPVLLPLVASASAGAGAVGCEGGDGTRQQDAQEGNNSRATRTSIVSFAVEARNPLEEVAKISTSPDDPIPPKSTPAEAKSKPPSVDPSAIKPKTKKSLSALFGTIEEPEPASAPTTPVKPNYKKPAETSATPSSSSSSFSSAAAAAAAAAGAAGGGSSISDLVNFKKEASRSGNKGRRISMAAYPKNEWGAFSEASASDSINESHPMKLATFMQGSNPVGKKELETDLDLFKRITKVSDLKKRFESAKDAASAKPPAPMRRASSVGMSTMGGRPAGFIGVVPKAVDVVDVAQPSVSAYETRKMEVDELAKSTRVADNIAKFGGAKRPSQHRRHSSVTLSSPANDSAVQSVPFQQPQQPQLSLGSPKAPPAAAADRKMLSQADAATPPAVDLLAELRQDPDADGDASSTPGIAAPTAAPIVRQLFSPSEQLSDSPATLAHHHQAKAESAHVGSSSTTASLSPLAAADATAAATAAAEMAVDASPPDSASQAMQQPESPADSAADSESVDPNEDTSAETSETDPDESTNHAYGNVMFSQMEVLALKLMFSLFDRSGTLTIGYDDLVAYAEETGDMMAIRDAKVALDILDIDGDGVIGLLDFIHFAARLKSAHIERRLDDEETTSVGTSTSDEEASIDKSSPGIV